MRCLRPLRSVGTVLLLALALALPVSAPAYGASRAGGSAQATSSSWWIGVLKSTACLFLPGVGCAGTPGAPSIYKYGSSADPNGLLGCGSGASQAAGGYGCSIDPNGLRPSDPGLTQPGAAYGCGIDPDGIRRCSGEGPVQPTSEYGSSADPDGLRH